MKIRNKATWYKWVTANQGAYGACVMRYAEAWANLMEERMGEDPAKLNDVAKQASHDADTEGITGFMYGCAVRVLADCWAHGDALRHWHNLDTQIGTEGYEANKTGGVLNPAVLVIGRKSDGSTETGEFSSNKPHDQPSDLYPGKTIGEMLSGEKVDGTIGEILSGGKNDAS